MKKHTPLLLLVTLLSFFTGCQKNPTNPVREYALEQGWHKEIIDFFMPVTIEQVEAITRNIDTPSDVVLQVDDFTITVLQTVANNTALYALIEVTSDSTGNGSPGWEYASVKSKNSEQAVPGSGGGYVEWIESTSEKTLCILSYVTAEKTGGQTAVLEISNLGCWENAVPFEDFSAENTGSWQLEWEFSFEDISVSDEIVYEEPFEVAGTKVGSVEFEITPVSIWMYLTTERLDIGAEPISVNLTDGTSIDFINLSETSTSVSQSGAKVRESIYYRFPAAIDPAEVESVTIAGVEFPLGH